MIIKQITHHSFGKRTLITGSPPYLVPRWTRAQGKILMLEASGTAPLAPILRQRSSSPSPNAGDKSVLDAKEAGNMMARLRQEGGRRNQKMRKSTDKNGVAKQGHTADKEKNKKVDCVSAAGVVPPLMVQQKTTMSLQFNARCDLINCEAYNSSLLYVKRMCADLP